MNIALVLTLSRIIIAPIIFFLVIFDQIFISILLFIFCGFTDYLDGYLARKLKIESRLGEILDPIGDKFLITFALISIAIYLSNAFIAFCAALIVARDIWVGALRNYNSRNNSNSATKVTFIAKFKTSLQIFVTFGYMVIIYLNIPILHIINDIFLGIVVLLTLYTGFSYTQKTFS